LNSRLSKKLLDKLKKLYPLRGKISEVRGDEIKLNIGQKVGVKIWQQFKVQDEDLTLEVISLKDDVSLAKITKGQGAPQKGLRVEAL